MLRLFQQHQAKQADRAQGVVLLYKQRTCLKELNAVVACCGYSVAPSFSQHLIPSGSGHSPFSLHCYGPKRAAVDNKSSLDMKKGRGWTKLYDLSG